MCGEGRSHLVRVVSSRFGLCPCRKGKEKKREGDVRGTWKRNVLPPWLHQGGAFQEKKKGGKTWLRRGELRTGKEEGEGLFT